MFCLLYTDLQARRFFEKSTRWSSCTAVARRFLISNTRSCESASRVKHSVSCHQTRALRIKIGGNITSHQQLHKPCKVTSRRVLSQKARGVTALLRLEPGFLHRAAPPEWHDWKGWYAANGKQGMLRWLACGCDWRDLLILREKLACSESQRDDFLSPAKSMSMTKQEDAAMHQQVTPATQKAAASNMSPFVAKLPLTSMEVPKVPPWGAESVTPATQKAVASNMSPFVAKPPLTSMEVPKVPRLPRKASLKCWKCHACHTKSCGVKYVPLRRQASTDIYGGTESTTPATQSEPEVLKVSRLPHKKPRRQICPPSSPSFHWHLWRYRKYHACHAKWAWSAESVTPATQNRGVKYVPLRRQASADIYGGTKSATPARQIEPEVLKVSRLPRQKPRRQICPPSSPSFRWHLWRCRKYHACHAKRAWHKKPRRQICPPSSPSFR